MLKDYKIFISKLKIKVINLKFIYYIKIIPYFNPHTFKSKLWTQ